MALHGVVWRESAKRVEDLGFYFKYIMEAILRIVAVSGHNGEYRLILSLLSSPMILNKRFYMKKTVE